MSTTRSGKVFRPEIPVPSDPSENPMIPQQVLNSYFSKKTISQGLLDVALLSANASQIKYVLSVGSEGPNGHPFYTLMISLVSMSILLQITTGICLILTGNRMDRSYFRGANLMNNLIMIQVFLVTVLNIIISSFGIKESDLRVAKMKQWREDNDAYFKQCTCINPARLLYSEAKLRNCETV